MAKASWLIPIYNKSAWLYETVKSIQNQTLKDIEIIFIDDGSTDGTTEMLKYFASKDKRIKVYKYKKNMGLGYAWNYGTKKVNSDIIIVGSGDDVWVPERSELTYKYFEKHKDVDVFYGSFWFTDHKLHKLEYKPAIPFSAKKMLTARDDGRCPQYIGHFTMAYRAETAKEVPYRAGLRVGIDYPFLVDLTRANKRFGWTNRVLGYARLLSSGVSMSRTQEVWENSQI